MERIPPLSRLGIAWRGGRSQAVELSATGEAVARGPVSLRLPHVPRNDEFLERLALDHKPFIEGRETGEKVACPDQRVSVPTRRIEQARAAKIIVNEIGEMIRGF